MGALEQPFQHATGTGRASKAIIAVNKLPDRYGFAPWACKGLYSFRAWLYSNGGRLSTSRPVKSTS
jgi:hypothetical protein